jgi:hypothetical protein
MAYDVKFIFPLVILYILFQLLEARSEGGPIIRL